MVQQKAKEHSEMLSIAIYKCIFYTCNGIGFSFSAMAVLVGIYGHITVYAIWGLIMSNAHLVGGYLVVRKSKTGIYIFAVLIQFSSLFCFTVIRLYLTPMTTLAEDLIHTIYAVNIAITGIFGVILGNKNFEGDSIENYNIENKPHKISQAGAVMIF